MYQECRENDDFEKNTTLHNNMVPYYSAQPHLLNL